MRTSRSPAGHGSTALTVTRSATTSPGTKVRTASGSAEAGRATRKSRTFSERPREHITFEGADAQSFTGNSFADFLLGTAAGYNELGVQDKGNWPAVSYAAYIQDNWRASRRLTLNLGLRWDGAPHTYESNNRMGNFYPKLYDPSQAATFDSLGNICSGPADPGCTAASPGLGISPNQILAGVPLYLNGIGTPEKNGVPKGLVNNHWAMFGPRLGFAYDLTGSGKTVIRGGFGIMYERIQGNDMYNAGPNIPFSLNVNLNNVTLANPEHPAFDRCCTLVPDH